MEHMAIALVLIIRLYDTGGLDPAEREVAIGTASAILRAAGMATEWPPCAVLCATPVGAGELVIRVARSSAPVADGHAVELGYSVIDPARGGGVLATVHLDRAERVASEAGVRVGIVLGRAMAHEVGHLLLGSATHQPRGLMQAFWTAEKLRRGRAGDWRFTPRQAEALHRALRMRVPVQPTGLALADVD